MNETQTIEHAYWHVGAGVAVALMCLYSTLEALDVFPKVNGQVQNAATMRSDRSIPQERYASVSVQGQALTGQVTGLREESF